VRLTPVAVQATSRPAGRSASRTHVGTSPGSLEVTNHRKSAVRALVTVAGVAVKRRLWIGLVETFTIELNPLMGWTVSMPCQTWNWRIARTWKS
jgi:hypothetical protein